MASSVLLSMTYFNAYLLGGMVLPNDGRVMCSRLVVHVVRDVLTMMTSYFKRAQLYNQFVIENQSLKERIA